MELLDRVALVTGAAQGIGSAIALGFAQEGADVALNDMDVVSARVVAKKIESLGRKAMVIEADVADENAVKKMVGKIIEQWGGVDILVNNAGIGSPLMVEDIDKADWDRVLGVNLGGTFNCSKAVIDTMKERGGGKIINISSMAARSMAYLEGANYTASKAAVLGFTRHLAFELGPFKINVNAICPGPTVTPLMESLTTAETLEKIRNEVALKELIRPEDIADTAVFLASKRARMITGFAIDVDGGVSLSSHNWEDYVKIRKAELAKRKKDGVSDK